MADIDSDSGFAYEMTYSISEVPGKRFTRRLPAKNDSEARTAAQNLVNLEEELGSVVTDIRVERIITVSVTARERIAFP